MGLSAATWTRLGAVLFAALAVLLADVSGAYAQAANCSRLQASVERFSRSTEFRNLQGNTQLARDLARQVQNAESTYIRNGCNDAARAGRTLTPQCQGIAREVLRLREQSARAASLVQAGNAAAQQREAVLQEFARFGCGTPRGSSATFGSERQNLFERIFGTSPEADFQGGEMVETPDYWGYGSYRTIRTVCVRLSDGYFWPVSYATVNDYLGQDAAQCQRMCPGEPVELYFYDNPGEEPEQMRNMAGQPYTALPSAFRYRDAFDAETSCNDPVVSGRIDVAETGDGGSRAMIDYGEARFPLPLRDPRRQSPVAVAALDAQFVQVPLPRPRPPGPGESPPAREIASADSAEADGLRLVQFGERVVRVVGPDTPYARSGATGR